MTKMRPSKSDLPEQLAEAIRQAWPDGVIDMPADLDNVPFWDVYPKLKANLSRISGTAAVYEREPQGGPRWSEASDPEEDPPDWDEESRSYHLFFLPLLDDRFQFETDILEPDEEGVEQRFQGEGKIGCAVGISLVAPFAVVTLDQMEVFENGSRSEPGVEPHIFDLDGRKLNVEEHYREMVDDEGMAVLRKLRTEVIRVLNNFEIAVIPEEELDKPVPWLRACHDVFLGDAGEPITVRHAFFFHGP